jgi:beta-aspartyl-peptidase (threonine type)
MPRTHDRRTPPHRRHPATKGALLAAAVLVFLPASLVWAGWRERRQVPPCQPCPGWCRVEVAPAEPPAPAGPPAEEAIRQVLDAQVAAWNRGDLEGFMAGYWSSPDLSFFSAGDKTRGWQATLERYRKRYQSGGAEMGRLTFRELEVEVLGPDSAFVRGRWQLERKKDRPGGLFTLLFKRLPEGWRIVHDHTSG